MPTLLTTVLVGLSWCWRRVRLFDCRRRPLRWGLRGFFCRLAFLFSLAGRSCLGLRTVLWTGYVLEAVGMKVFLGTLLKRRCFCIAGFSCWYWYPLWSRNFACLFSQIAWTTEATGSAVSSSAKTSGVAWYVDFTTVEEQGWCRLRPGFHFFCHVDSFTMN